MALLRSPVAASNVRCRSILGVPTLQTGVFGGLIVAIFFICSIPTSRIEFCLSLGFVVENALYRLLRLWRQLLSAIAVAVDTGTKVWRRFLLVTSGHNANFAAFIYAVGERSLFLFGLHHIWNVPFYYNFGDYMTKSGQLVTGVIPVFFAQLRDGAPLTAGLFMTGRFPIMMFALPAAALWRCIREAKPERRR